MDSLRKSLESFSIRQAAEPLTPVLLRRFLVEAYPIAGRVLEDRES